MVKFILKRLLWLIPVVGLVVIMLFLLDQYTTRDQLNRAMIGEGKEQNELDDVKLYQNLAKSKKWDIPPFYFSIDNRGWSADFYSVVTPKKRQLIRQVSRLTLNEEGTQKIFSQLVLLIDQHRYSSDPFDKDWKQLITAFDRNGQINDFWNKLSTTSSSTVQSENLSSLLIEVKRIHQARRIWNAWPKISWHGADNRFHHFINEYIFKGNRTSLVDGIPVYKKVLPALGITLFINLICLVLILIIGLRIGRWMFEGSNKMPQQITRILLYLMYALPLFWLATLILIMAGWIPGGGLTGTPHLQSGETPTVLTFIRPSNLSYLILPIVSITLTLLVVIVIQMDRALKETNEAKFILAARTKGLSETYITKRHNMPVAIYSIVTMIGNSIPALISGSVVVEIIFNIPGMGRLLWHSLYAYDWNVVNAILLLGVVLSIIGQLLTDLAYYYINPALRTAA